MRVGVYYIIYGVYKEWQNYKKRNLPWNVGNNGRFAEILTVAIEEGLQAAQAVQAQR